MINRFKEFRDIEAISIEGIEDNIDDVIISIKGGLYTNKSEVNEVVNKLIDYLNLTTQYVLFTLWTKDYIIYSILDVSDQRQVISIPRNPLNLYG